MKIVMTFSFLLMSSCLLFSQIEAYSNKTSSEIQLYLYYDKKQFEVIENLESEAEDALAVRYLLPGIIESNEDDNIIICRNGRQIFTLKRVNEYLIINNNMPHLGDSLYVIIRNNSREHFSGQWGNGKKHGYWHFWENGEVYFEKYYKGNLVGSREKVKAESEKSKITRLRF